MLTLAGDLPGSGVDSLSAVVEVGDFHAVGAEPVVSDGEAVGLRHSDEEVIGVVSTGAVDVELVLEVSDVDVLSWAAGSTDSHLEVVGGVLGNSVGVEVVGLDNLTFAGLQVDKVLFFSP